MAPGRRTLFFVLGSILALILIVVLAIPLFLNADSFRPRIESTLSTAMGRKVTLGKLELSVLTGSVVAQSSAVADDPAFSTLPFLQTGAVKIHVEMVPLIVSHEIRVTGFTMDAPRINLLRAANGTWNYSSIGSAHKKPTADNGATIPNLTVGHVSITNGQLTVSTAVAPGAPAAPARTYDKLTFEAKDFAFDKNFPFTAAIHLPGDGTVSLKGTAGPIDKHDASLTPFTAELDMKHLDPVAAGFLGATSGITGVIDAITVQAAWNGHQLHVSNLLIDAPKLTLLRTNKPAAPAPPPTPNRNDMLSTLTADHLQIKNGAITITSSGQSKPAVYQQLNAEATNFSPTTASPFKLSAQIPGGGSLTADGTSGPLNQQDDAASPLNVHATLTHVDLASSGIVAPDAGISGLANIDIKAISDGKNMNASAAANVQELRLARNGSPSAKPVSLQMTVAENMQSLTGQIQRAVVTIGSAVFNIAGTYQASGPNTAINLKVATQNVSIDELEAFLPSVGVHLPTGSRLQGGTLTTNLNVTGSTANPIISGPLQLNNTNLAGFDLGSKLSTITALTGAKTGSVTAIKSLSTNINVANGNVRTDNLALDVPALGTATGEGTVSADGALNYQILLKLTGLLGAGSSGGAATGLGGIAGQLLGIIPAGAAGGAAGSIGALTVSVLKNGIPIAIGGTTASPTFTPNLSGILSGGAGSVANSKQAPAKKPNTTDSLTNVLGGLLKQH